MIASFICLALLAASALGDSSVKSHAFVIQDPLSQHHDTGVFPGKSSSNKLNAITSVEAVNAGKVLSHLAAEFNDVDFLTKKNLFNASALDGQGQVPACWAASKGSVEFGQKMVDLGLMPSINTGQCVYGSDGKNKVIGTPLQAAAYHRRKDYVALLVSQPDVEMINEQGSGSPFHAMALLKPPTQMSNEVSQTNVIDNEIVSILDSVNKDAITSLDADGRTAFEIAIKSANPTFADLLRQNGGGYDLSSADHRDRKGFSIVHLAGDLPTLEYVIKSASLLGITLNLDIKSEPDQLTPLHVAVLEKKPFSLLKYLIELPSVDKSAVTSRGQGIVHLAVQEGNVKATDLFFGQKAPFPPFSIRDKNGRTPLLLAIEVGKHELARRMIATSRHFGVEHVRDDRMPNTQDTAIHLATRLNQPMMVLALLNREKTMVSLVNAAKEMPLHLAVGRHNVAIVKILLKYISIANLTPQIVNQHDVHGRTFFNLLAKGGCSPAGVEVGKQLLQAFANETVSLDTSMKIEDEFGETAIEAAVRANCFEMVEQLFLANNSTSNYCTLRNRQGYTPLHVAKMLGFDNLVEAMVSNGALNCSLDQVDVCGLAVRQIKDKDRCDPLPLIANGEIIEAVGDVPTLCIGAKVKFSCGESYSLRGLPLIECNPSGKWEIKGHCEALLAAGTITAPGNALPGIVAATPTPAKILAITKPSKFIKQRPIIQLSSSCGAGDEQDAVPLYITCQTPNFYKEQALCMRQNATSGDSQWQLNADCYLDIRRAEKELFEACYQGDTNRTRSLLASQQVDVGAVVDPKEHGQIGGMRPTRGWSCLSFAAYGGKAETVRMLIRDFELNTDQQEDGGWTALHLAAIRDHLDIAQVLVEDGNANIELKHRNGRTALMWASMYDSYDIVDFLIKLGAKVNERDNKGRTARALAANAKYEQIEQLLIKHGGIL